MCIRFSVIVVFRICDVINKMHKLVNRLKMAIFRKKASGNADQKLYESPDLVSRFEPVRLWLNKHCKKVS